MRFWRIPIFIGIAVMSACSRDAAPTKASGTDDNPAEGRERTKGSRANQGKSLDDAPEVFRDVTDEVGVDFSHFTGATGHYYFPEIMGAGVAVLDYDGDGDLDVYLLQGSLVMTADSIDDALFPPRTLPLTNRLYRNDLVLDAAGRRTLHFTDVTETAGVGDTGYAMGCAVADYDNDGDPDIYVTNFGANVMYRNEGDGTFTKLADAAGADDPRWSTSAAFADLDRDGFLDLVVVNYVAFVQDVERACRRSAGDRDYCSPLAYQPLPDSVFHNNGDGTFTDVSAPIGIASLAGNGLGVIAADFDTDGLIDVFVANDGVENRLWMNRDGTMLEDTALMSGVAFNGSGDAQACMGVTVADFDRDGDEDLFITNLFGETNSMYVNQGGGVFDDQTFRQSLGAVSRGMTGFGTEFLDYDGDGTLDLFVVNGAVAKIDAQLADPYPYMMSNQLFRGRPDGRFEDMSAGAGSAFARLECGRGLAIGDLDLDGDVDAVVTNNNGRARVLLNQVGSRNHWLRVGLEGTRSNRDGLGAYISVERRGGAPLFERVHTDGSYCSARDRRALFGLGDAAEPVSLVVRWPDGRRERWADVAVDSEVTLREGSGEVVP